VIARHPYIERCASLRHCVDWTAGDSETHSQLDTFRSLKTARRTNSCDCKMAAVGKAEAGSAGEQTGEEYPFR